MTHQVVHPLSAQRGMLRGCAGGGGVMRGSRAWRACPRTSHERMRTRIQMDCSTAVGRDVQDRREDLMHGMFDQNNVLVLLRIPLVSTSF